MDMGLDWDIWDGGTDNELSGDQRYCGDLALLIFKKYCYFAILLED